MRYLISVSYNGSKLYGFQRLPKHKTVQGELERVLSKINKTVVYVKGAGRTDRGVHALDQGVSFDLSINIDCDHLKKAMNSLLDESIYVNSVKEVNNDFHARFDVKKKKYKYVINMGEYDPINNDFLYNYNKKLNIKEMKKASKYMIGRHSFEAFTSGERESYNSEIYSIKFKKKKNLLYITFVGKSFYRYMVRNLVGSLIYVGENKGKPEIINDLIEQKGEKITYMTVPAGGLYLEKVEY